MEVNQEEGFNPLRKSNNGPPVANRRSAPKGHTNTQAEDNFRWQNGIEVKGDGCPPPVMSFEEAGLDRAIHIYLEKKGIKIPTPIQKQGISCLLTGRDVIAIAPTGSGKTLAYTLPMVSKIMELSQNEGTQGPVALVLVPTRELMQQIVDVTREVISFSLVSSEPMNRPDLTYTGVNVPYDVQVTKTNSLKDMMPHIRAHGQVENHPYSVGPRYGTDLAALAVDPYSNFSSFPSRGIMPSLSFLSRPSTTASCPMQVAGSIPRFLAPISRISATEIDQNRVIPNRNTLPLSVEGVCGGIKISEQIESLSKKIPPILVATPGRLIDLVERGILSFNWTSYVVLDECDRMLDLGLEGQIRKVISMITLTSLHRQFSLWSATLPDDLERLARSAVVDPIIIYVGVRDFVSTSVTQTILFMHTYQKDEMLLKTLRNIPYPPVIVFASSKEIVDHIVDLLREEQFHVCGLHSDKEQNYRFQAISAFRRGHVDVLVATDLASRGLDVPEVTHVINYDLPEKIEDYIHRCGRTGRYGRPGMATSFLTLKCKIACELKELLELSGMPIPRQLDDLKQFGHKVLVTQFGDRIIE